MRIWTVPVGGLGTNCYLAADAQGNCAVIDPGDEAEALAELLKKLALHPVQILLTHGHYDHIGAVQALQKQFGCRVAIGMQDEQLLEDPGKSLARMARDPERYLLRADRLLEEGDTVQVGELEFLVWETPGHTPGGVTYQCEDVLFTGDTLFAGSVGRTDFYGGNYQQLMDSVQKLKGLPGDFRVLPGHGPESRMSVEKRRNPYLQMEDR